MSKMPKQDGHLTTGSAHLIRQIDLVLKQAKIPRCEQDLDGATIGAIASIVCFTQQSGLTLHNKKAYLALAGAIYEGMARSMGVALDAENIPITKN